MQQLSRTTIISLFAIMSLAVAIWTGKALVREILQLKHSLDAPRVTAKLLSFRDVRIGDGVFRTEFTYAYQYAGKNYETTTRDIGPFADPHKGSAALKNAYRRGETVSCLVYMENPQQSYLIHPFSLPRFLMALIFPVCFGGGLAVVSWHLISKLRDRFREPPDPA